MNTTTVDKDSPLPVVIIILVFLALGAAYIAGLFPDVMETDAAQYASISREMAESGNYLEVLHRGEDYLDKPPLLFWLSSLSIQVFGASAWAYKLPSFLFTILGIWSVFRFTLIYYPRKAALYAAFILASCQAWFLFNNDVRTDTILAGSVIFSVWQIARYLEYKNIWGVILGAVGIAAAMMAKGPIGIMAPALAVGSHLVFARRWKTFFRPGWLLMLVIVAILLIPMCYGLYTQYGMDGLEFFFWKQSFGRITGENEWRNDTGYFYFLHTFPWAFIPWALMAIAALFFGLLCLTKNRFKVGKSQPEAMSLFGFLLPFIALSFSHYKLPHYIFVTFPFAAVFCAKFLYQSLEKSKKQALILGTIIPGIIAIVGVSALASIYVFSFTIPYLLMASVGFVLIGVSLFYGRKSLFMAEKALLVAIFCTAFSNFALNTLFYPELLTYQPGKAAAAWLQKNETSKTAALYYVSDHPLEFHAGRILPYLYSSNMQEYVDHHPGSFIYTDDFGLEDLQNFGYQPKIEATFPRQHPALLSITFLNPKTRHLALGNRYWLTLD